MEFRTPIEKITELANMMNEQTVTPVFASDKMLHAIDATITPEEVDFMLNMGGGRLSREEIQSKENLSEEKFTETFESLLEKGHITELDPQHENDDKIFHIMSIFPGWFELFLMRGAETPDRKLFAERMDEVFRSALEMGDPEFINQVLQVINICCISRNNNSVALFSQFVNFAKPQSGGRIGKCKDGAFFVRSFSHLPGN